MSALRFLALASLVMVAACAPDEETPAQACTEAFCECTLPEDCGAGLACVQGVCIPSAPDVSSDASAPDAIDTSDTTVEDMVSAPDTTPQDTIVEVVDDLCIQYCEARVACDLEPIAGFSGPCEQACEQFAQFITEGTQGAADPEACNESFLAFSNCMAGITDCAEHAGSDSGVLTTCADLDEARARDCAPPDSEEPDDGSSQPDEGSAAPDEGSASPDEGSAGSGK